MDRLKKYAELAVKKGVNLQKGQVLLVNADVETRELVREIVNCAYDVGARQVFVEYSDEPITAATYKKADDAIFDEFLMYKKTKADYLLSLEKGFAGISVTSSDPDYMSSVDPNKMIRARRAARKHMQEFEDVFMKDEMQWCVIGMPSAKWARKVFPDIVDDEKAMDKLFDAIAKSVRLDEKDPVKAWDDHCNKLNDYANKLNSLRLSKLHFKNSLGTDLTVGLPKNYIFAAADSINKFGTSFIANMPTEEVFSMPKKDEVNGKVVSSMPLNHNGTLIEGFELEFENGKVISSKAKKGNDALEKILNTDEGARYLGEVALVPYSSPISLQNILFFNTLYDENASCHLALGEAYPNCIKDGAKMSKEELSKNGANDSAIHIDFMFGTKDMNILGYKEDGSTIQVFEKW